MKGGCEENRESNEWICWGRLKFLFVFFFFSVFLMFIWTAVNRNKRRYGQLSQERHMIQGTPFSNLNFFRQKSPKLFRDWINEYSLIQSQTLRILHFLVRIFDEFFFRISRQIPENSDVCRFFNQICENKLEICRKLKFWILWKLFSIIQNYSLVSLLLK